MVKERMVVKVAAETAMADTVTAKIAIADTVAAAKERRAITVAVETTVKNLDITVQAQTAVEITVQAAQKAVDTAQEAAPITAVA
jgi:hypothetical protein